LHPDVEVRDAGGGPEYSFEAVVEEGITEQGDVFLAELFAPIPHAPQNERAVTSTALEDFISEMKMYALTGFTYALGYNSVVLAVKQKRVKNGNMGRVPDSGEVSLAELESCWVLLD
jgi:hypothetical protein